MTVEATAPVPQAPQATPAPAEPPRPSREELLASVDEFGQHALTLLEQQTGQLNTVVGQIRALEGDEEALLASLKETSENPQVRELNDIEAQILDKLDEVRERRTSLLKVEVAQMRAQSGQEVDKLKENEGELRKKVNAARNYLKVSYPTLEALIPKVEHLKTGRATGQTGVRRIRHRKVTVNVGSENEKTFSNFTDAAKELKSDTEQLQAAFFKAAGGDQPDNWADVVNFAYGEGDDAVGVRVAKSGS